MKRSAPFLIGVLITAAGVGNLFAADWAAFHGGGPLVGVAEPIAAPPMKLRWTYDAGRDTAPTSQPIVDEGGARPSFESSAAIVGNSVYAATRSGALVSIDLKTGKRNWIYRAEAGFSASPAVIGSVVYIGDEDGTFHAVDAGTGRKRWTFEAGAPIHSSPNFVGDKILFGDDGADIYCLAAGTGKKIWAAKAGDRINGAPAVASLAPGTPIEVIVSGCDAQLRAIDLASGKEAFSKDMGALCPGSPALADGRILVGTDGGKVVCLSSEGKQLWEFPGVGDEAMVYSSPAVADATVVIGARDRNVYGLDLTTGRQKWKFATRGDVDSSPVLSGGRVYIGSKDKRLYVLDLTTGQKLWEFVASRGIVATPAVAQNVLVIGDTGGHLYCLESRP